MNRDGYSGDTLVDLLNAPNAERPGLPDPGCDVHMGVHIDVARAFETMTTMRGGLCPACGRITPQARDEAVFYLGVGCGHCGFKITGDEVKAIVDANRFNLHTDALGFARWRRNRKDESR